MGAEPYQYIVDYEENIQNALNKLREIVFKSGDFCGIENNPKTPDEALELADEEGTKSILDINTISDEPDYESASPFDSDELIDYFGTNKPTIKMIKENNEFWNDIERGMARYIIIYKDDKPDKIFFAGYSFD